MAPAAMRPAGTGGPSAVVDVATLERVAAAVDPEVSVVGRRDRMVSGIDLDSRRIAPGVAFACVRGAHHDGHDFARSAVAAGAPMLVVDHPLDPVPEASEVSQLVVADVRAVLGPLAAELWGRPSTGMTVVGVTGTNGKTTTTQLLGAILGAAGRRCAVVGTLSGARTTPEAPDLQEQLAALSVAGNDAVAMEVSSHALAQHRVDGTRFRVAVFTNLGRDHLDYHGDLESYYRAKARLFSAPLSDEAVVCVDDEAGRRLAGEATVPVTTCSRADAEGVEPSAEGTRWLWRGHPVHLRLPGGHNVANAVVAATVASRLGVDDATIAVGLGEVASVPGRFERVDLGQPFTVAVDFAHTPDALAAVLDAARELAAPGARVIVVFGCGGERDVAKRAEMGRVAALSGASIVLTADNSRSEETGVILDAIVTGVAGVEGAEERTVVEPDRRRAIGIAVDLAGDGDVVVVAGRGHESHLDLGSGPMSFDDRVVVGELLAGRGFGGALGGAGHQGGDVS